MSGQISIRLPDETIKRLNRTARKSKKKRAEILRAAIEVGLRSLENQEATSTDKMLNELHDDLTLRLTNLEKMIETMLDQNENFEHSISSSDASSDAVEETAISAIATAPELTTDTSVELLPADSRDDEEATMVLAPDVIETETVTAPPPQEKRPAELFQSATGELRTDRRVRDAVIDVNPESDQRISSRLRRARLHKGWDIETLSAELNMKRELLEDIENGRCDVPRSRGIRVEAKLQQWEAEMNR